MAPWVAPLPPPHSVHAPLWEILGVLGCLNPPHRTHLRIFLCSSLCSSSDLLVAVNHLRHEPYGQHHDEHIHHDLRYDGRHVSVGCRGQEGYVAAEAKLKR